MTGYGAAEPSADGGRWQVEVRSTNHRFLEVVVRLLQQLLCRHMKYLQKK